MSAQMTFSFYKPKEICQIKHRRRSTGKTAHKNRNAQQKEEAQCFFPEMVNTDAEIDKIVKPIANDGHDFDNTPNVVCAKTTNEENMNKIFIVHGHDDIMKRDVAKYVKKLGFKPIILNEQINAGLTIIEKLEKLSDTDYAIVLYSPCDVGSKNVENPELKFRARQNVVFEHGYLCAKLGRDRVAALVKDDVELPSDINGILFIPYKEKEAEWKNKIAKELSGVGYEVNIGHGKEIW